MEWPLLGVGIPTVFMAFMADLEGALGGVLGRSSWGVQTPPPVPQNMGPEGSRPPRSPSKPFDTLSRLSRKVKTPRIILISFIRP